MKIQFCKFDGAGNDFVVVDIRDGLQLSEQQVKAMCHRRFGIGADGLMTLDSASVYGADFEMKYYNSDGRQGSMCGNGGRCIVAFAFMLGLGHKDEESGRTVLSFDGYDGRHKAEIVVWDDASSMGIVRLSMKDVDCSDVHRCGEGWFLDTGSPHYVQRVVGLDAFDVVGEGRRLRNRTDLFPEGANIDFVEDGSDGSLRVRTYERGVEDETWACGTGVTAAAIVSGNRRVSTRGGDFKVEFNATGKSFTNVWLTGPVSFNFRGEMDV